MHTVEHDTGWDRSSWELLADRLISGAHRYSSPGKARVSFPSHQQSDATSELEGFARSFLLAAIRIAGAQGSCPELSEWYAAAFTAGTRPDSPEGWPPLRDHGQPTVEATAIAVGLHLSRPWLWDVLPDQTKFGLITWFSGSTGNYGADNNHVLFGATIQAFLASVHAPFDAFEIEAALDRIEDWYAGDGWYSDGDGRRFDHYNAWTFHLYPFFILDMLDPTNQQAADTASRRHIYRRRLAQFLDGYQHLFSGSGAPLIQGRSLTYRWGVVAPFWMGELQGVSPLPPGRTRRLASSTAKYFTDHGVGSDGVLTLGWWKDNSTHILQSYNAAGSPLWASKGFMGLLLPQDHPSWTSDEKAKDIERGDVSRVLSGPQWLVTATQKDDIVRVANFGAGGHPRQDSPLYRRLAFSTSSAPTQHASIRDNDIYVPVNGATSENRGPAGGVARPHGGSLKFSIDAGGRSVAVDYATTILDDAVELRIARILGCVALPLTVSGYSLASDERISTRADSTTATAQNSEGLSSSIAVVTAATSSTLPARPMVHHAPASILGTHVVVPSVEFSPATANDIRIAWLVRLGGTRVDLSAVAERLSLEWSSHGARMTCGPLSRNLTWIRRDTWPADTIGQGVFGP